MVIAGRDIATPQTDEGRGMAPALRLWTVRDEFVAADDLGDQAASASMGSPAKRPENSQ
jgi:hypothetical protein